MAVERRNMVVGASNVINCDLTGSYQHRQKGSEKM